MPSIVSMLNAEKQACFASALIRLGMNLLSERIRHVLDQSGHNPSSLAKKIGCSAAAVQQWLSGDTKNIKNELLFAVADATGFEPRWIGTGQGPERQPKEDERTKKLAELYAQLDERGRDAVFRVAEAEYVYVIPPPDKTGTHD